MSMELLLVGTEIVSSIRNTEQVFEDF